ncbi:MAG: trimethylamine methyltransferase family protein [Anaerolineales bacterium]|nr:trimethylamine methyltransferase family protein [Anaerolineales bacterium]
MRPSLQVLSTELIEQILTEAKRVLWEVGIEVRGAELRQRLLDYGLPAGSSSLHIRFPAEVVDQAIASAPGSFKLYNRDGEIAADIGGDRTHFTPGSSGLKILDHRTGETRLANTTDFVEYVRLGDGLEHIPYLATAFSTNDDIEAGVSDAWRLFLCLTQSKKPIVSGAFTEHGVARMAAMMELFRSGRQELIEKPMAIFTITATGNFRYSEDSCQNLLDCVEAGIPVEIVPVTLMGLIAPVTLVGAAVFHTVDVLAGVTMAQIVKPGAPVLFGGAPASFHMREATSPMLGIDALRLDVAYAAIGKHLGLPTQAYMALSDAKSLDAQAGAESFGSAMLAALASINSVSGPGMLDFVLVFSLPKLVLDNAFCGQIHHFRREIEVVEDLPVAELIDELLREQHLITAEHTLKHWQSELHMPDRVIDRSNRENWLKAGSPDLDQRSRSEVESRLANYHPIETDPIILTEMERLIRSGLRNPDVALPGIPPLARAPRTVQVESRGRRRRRR